VRQHALVVRRDDVQQLKAHAERAPGTRSKGDSTKVAKAGMQRRRNAPCAPKWHVVASVVRFQRQVVQHLRCLIVLGVKGKRQPSTGEQDTVQLPGFTPQHRHKHAM